MFTNSFNNREKNEPEKNNNQSIQKQQYPTFPPGGPGQGFDNRPGRPPMDRYPEDMRPDDRPPFDRYPDRRPDRYPDRRPPEPPFDRYPDRRRPDNERYPDEQGGMPQSPPPRAIPRKSPTLYAVDPGAIQGCLYSYTYIWLKNGNSFWLFPTYVGRKSVSGFRYTRYGWRYVGFDLDLIETFSCA